MQYFSIPGNVDFLVIQYNIKCHYMDKILEKLLNRMDNSRFDISEIRTNIMQRSNICRLNNK